MSGNAEKVSIAPGIYAQELADRFGVEIDLGGGVEEIPFFTSGAGSPYSSRLRAESGAGTVAAPVDRYSAFGVIEIGFSASHHYPRDGFAEASGTCCADSSDAVDRSRAGISRVLRRRAAARARRTIAPSSREQRPPRRLFQCRGGCRPCHADTYSCVGSGEPWLLSDQRHSQPHRSHGGDPGLPDLVFPIAGFCLGYPRSCRPSQPSLAAVRNGSRRALR